MASMRSKRSWCPISLYDTLVATRELERPDPRRLPLGAPATAPRRQLGELARRARQSGHRAVQLLRSRAGVDQRHSHRAGRSEFPSAAGLGGGSSDAAAALLAANAVWNLGWPREQLAELAAELGSDVPFFLAGGPADLPRPRRTRSSRSPASCALALRRGSAARGTVDGGGLCAIAGPPSRAALGAAGRGARARRRAAARPARFTTDLEAAAEPLVALDRHGCSASSPPRIAWRRR